VVGGSHQLVGGVERNLGDARGLLARLDRVDPTLCCEHHERAFGRIADELTLTSDGVGGERHGQQVGLQVHFRQAADAGDLASGGIALARDGQPLAEVAWDVRQDIETVRQRSEALVLGAATDTLSG
jgi:hypothetical protein